MAIDPVLRAMLEEPIGSRELQQNLNPQNPSPEAKEAARRASKIWLPEGKRSASGRDAKEARQAFYERQVDLEDVVEAAGGARGALRA